MTGPAAPAPLDPPNKNEFAALVLQLWDDLGPDEGIDELADRLWNIWILPIVLRSAHRGAPEPRKQLEYFAGSIWDSLREGKSYEFHGVTRDAFVEVFTTKMLAWFASGWAVVGGIAPAPAPEPPQDGSPERIGAIIAALNEALYTVIRPGAFGPHDSGRLIGALLKRGLEIRALAGVRVSERPAPDNDGTSWDCVECGTNVTGPSVSVSCPHCGAFRMKRRFPKN